MKISAPHQRQIEGDVVSLETRFGVFGIFEAEDFLTIFVNEGKIEVIQREGIVQMRTKKELPLTRPKKGGKK